MAVVVTAGPQDTNDQVIKKFKRQIMSEDLVNKIKERKFYKKPSVLKKEKLSEVRKQKKRRLQAKRRGKTN